MMIKNYNGKRETTDNRTEGIGHEREQTEDEEKGDEYCTIQFMTGERSGRICFIFVVIYLIVMTFLFSFFFFSFLVFVYFSVCLFLYIIKY